MIHKKQDNEHLTFLAEKNIAGKKMLVLGMKNTNMEFAKRTQNGMYVEYTCPLLTFVFIVSVVFFGIMTLLFY